MGMSSDATIVYGVPLEEAESGPPGNMTDEQWEEAFYAYGKQDWEVLGFQVMQHCSDSYPMYILTVPGSKITTYRGNTVPISPAMLFNAADDLAKFRAAMAKYNISTEEEGWYLGAFEAI